MSKKVTALAPGFGSDDAMYHNFGRACEVLSVARGWATIRDYAGKVRKVRSTEVILVLTSTIPADAPAAVDPQENKVMAKPTKATKATKSRATKDTKDAPRRSVGRATYDPTRYTKVKSAAGNVSLDSGDAVASRLRGMELPDVYEFAAKRLDCSVRSLKERYSHLNPGMQRMNLGNKLRAFIK